jgi:recombinational DNA repair protein RecT
MSDTRDRTTTAGADMREAGMPAGQAPAKATGGRMTVQQGRENARVNMVAMVEANRSEIERFLAAFGIDFEFFLAGLKVFLMNKMQKEPDFFDTVTPDSFMEALLRAAMNGVLCDGKEAAIGVYKGVATFMPMRDGMVKVLWRTGMIKSINDQTVTVLEYQAARFDYQEGDDGFITHRLDLMRKDTDETAAAYCIIELVTGGVMREVVPKDELEKIARMSKSPARGAWKHQMHRKAAIRRIMGKMPRDKGIALLLAHDDDNYLLTGAGGESEPSIPKKKLFGGRVAVRRPKKAAPPPLQDQGNDAPAGRQSEGSDAQDGAGDETDRFPGFVLQAVLTTKNGLQQFDDVELWRGDLIHRLTDLKDNAAALPAFWKTNLPHVIEAGRNGYGSEALKVLEAAEQLDLPITLETDDV